MTDISLRSYTLEIKDLIEHGRFDEAIAHCQHILETFPKCIEAYRLLGKAFLEQSRHGDAADVFQRVLSVVPDDWISHVAMAIVREDESNLDMAIWHMERAYEVNPSNGTVQQEIRRLRGRRDGVEPPKLRLTRAALARMYIKGGLYSQAIAEIKGALVEDPDRPDLQVLLASALFESGALQDAADICNGLLKKLPFCMDANRIMGLVLRQSEKRDDADRSFQRLVQIDPYIDPDTIGSDNRLGEHPANGILLTRLEWEAQLKTEKTKQPSWAASLGIKLEDQKSTGGSLPDWLASAGPPPMPVSAPTPEPPASPWLSQAAAAAEPAINQTPASGFPSWLSSAMGPESTPATETPPAPVPAFGTGPESQTTGVPDWVNAIATPAAPAPAEAAEPPQGSTGELPDWVKSQSVDDSTPAPSLASALPDWLSAPAAPMEVAPPRETTTPATLPDWVKQPAESPPTASAPPQTGSLPDWLSAPTPPSVDALPTSSLPEWAVAPTTPVHQAGDVAQLPNWLNTTQPRPEPSTGEEPDWMKPKASEPGTESGMPDWMKGIEPAPGAGELKPEEMPDWLKPPSSAAGAELVPEWMRSKGEGTTVEPKAAVMGAPAVTGSTEEIPEWMKPESTPVRLLRPQIAPSADVPDWMKEDEPVAVTPEPDMRTPSAAVDIPSQKESTAPGGGPSADEPAISDPAAPVASLAPDHAAPPAAPAVSMPDWLSAPITAPDAAAALPGEEAGTTASEPDQWPDWLKKTAPPEEVAAVEPEQQTESEPSPIPGDLPEWLSAQAPAEEIGPSPARELEQVQPAISFPDWLGGSSKEEAADPAAETSTADQAPAAGFPDWLEKQTAKEEAVFDEKSPEQTLEEWLHGSSTDGAAEERQAAVAPATDALPMPDWLSGQDISQKQSAADTGKLTSGEVPVVEEPASAPPSMSNSSDVPTPTPSGLPDWLTAPRAAGAPAAPSASGSSLPLPDWLQPSGSAPAKKPVMDWDTAAKQAVPPPPAKPSEVTRPSTGATGRLPTQSGTGRLVTPGGTGRLGALDNQRPSDPVARWLDRRLKTSTLRSLDEATSKMPAKTEESAPAPAEPAKPAPGGTQLPTWLDYQRPGASDTVVQWIDRRVPTSQLTEPKPAVAPKEKIPTKPLTKTVESTGQPAMSATPGPVVPTAPTQIPSTPPPPAPMVGQGTARPSMPQEFSAPRQVPSGREPVAPARADIPPTLSGVAQWPPAAAAPSKNLEALPGEEEEGEFVPPPEWLQRALGSAVNDVPPVPKIVRGPTTQLAKGPAKQIPSDSPVEIPGAPEGARPSVPAKVPKYEDVIKAREDRERPGIPLQAKRLPTKPLSDYGVPRSAIPEGPVRASSPIQEEPPPAIVAGPGRWVPAPATDAPERRPAGLPESAARSGAKPARRKSRKVTEIEAEAILREARVYMETDLTKAADAYQRVLEVPAMAKTVCSDVQTYLEQDPDAPQLWNLLGDALSKVGDLREAYRAYEEALKRM